jgi:hypothetical protein
VFDANNGDDEQSTMRMSDNGTTAYPAHSFNGALALDWRWKIPATPDTYWAQAYTAVNSDGQFDKYTGPPLYETLMQLFGAIQMAGPHLTPTSIQQGMLKWQRAEIGLTSPLAGTALGAPWFVQDEVLLRWNSTEVTPGGGDSASGATGCYDVIGPRSALGAWPQGDQSTDPGSCGADWSSYSAGVSGGQPPNS